MNKQGTPQRLNPPPFKSLSIFRVVDFHILYMLLLVFAFVALAGLSSSRFRLLGLIILIVCPQGRILTRVLYDFPRSKRPVRGYLVSNEAMVAGAAVLCLIIWYFLGRH
jgi:hypothetical protein